VHYRLGLLFGQKKDYAAAAVHMGKAVELDPKHAAAHEKRGQALVLLGKIDEAIVSYKRAISLDLKNANAHYSLGNALKDKGQVDEAIACFQKAIALDPKFVTAHNSLGFALDAVGKQKEAIEAWRRAVRLEPGLAMTHYWLGKALVLQGRPREALVPLNEAARRLPAAQARALGLPAELSRAERLCRLEKRLPAVLAGKERIADNRERVELTELCQRQQRFAAATRFAAAALADDPRLAADPQIGFRYKAACSAGRAAAGQGEDAGQLKDGERLALRRRALTWLRAELTLWTRLVASGEVGRSRLARVLTHWQKDADLAGIRDKAALARLSAAERAACVNLWAGVAALLKKTKPSAKKG
jgi:tetratricopeptide (TPR) repeat protein